MFPHWKPARRRPRLDSYVCVATGRRPFPEGSWAPRCIPAVETAEQASAEHADCQHAEPERCRIGREPEIEAADAAHEDIRDNDVEEAPKHIHARRGEALAWGRSKRGLERLSHHAGDEMRNGVCEKGPAEEVRQEIEPLHFTRPASRAVQ